jgi:4'-phosphopantetheinyl transferase
MNEKQHIIIWAGNPDEVTTDDMTALSQVLDAEEREHHATLKNEAVKRQYILSHVLLRLLISSRFNAHPSYFRFIRLKWQKPYIQDQSFVDNNIDFNISHTNGSVVCAVIESGEIGIDVEICARAMDVDLLAPYCLTKQELKYINSYSESERNDRFLHIWTLKEAYLKGRGIGLHHPPTDIQVDVSSLTSHQPRVHMISAEGDDSWHFRQFHPTRLHIGAVAFKTYNGIEPQINFLHISIESIRYALRSYYDANKQGTSRFSVMNCIC